MASDSRELFDEVWRRVATINTIKTLSQTPMYVLKKEDLPYMQLTFETEMPAYGDPTAGEPNYDPTLTIYCAYVLAGDIDDTDITLMEETLDLVEAVLFTDPTFTRKLRGFGTISRSRPDFSKIEETNVCSLRESIGLLMHQISFPPTIDDVFATLTVITKTTPSGQPPDKFTIYRKWDIPQE